MPAKPTMQIYRAADVSASPNDAENSKMLPISEATQAGFARLLDAGVTDGIVGKQLFDVPGFRLSYIWFKPHFPLPRHSHKQDCLYYIVAGRIKLGTEWFGAGDGFFLPDATPYTFTIGDEGLELLEFRTSDDTNFRAFDHTAAWWDKAVKAVEDNRDAWRAAKPPRPALSA
jgi:hypothetical protein